MSIRKGIENIRERNQEIAERSARSGVPELFLYNDGDVAIFRILSDEPLDVDFHEIYDPAVSKAPLFFYCSNEDCEHCARGDRVVRMYMFWIWVERILHRGPSDTGAWKLVEVGNRKYYLEDCQYVGVFKRKFGRGQLWQQFENIFETYGTWKDREYSFRRSGVKGDINTTYTLTPLDKSPNPDNIRRIVERLPLLESVANGSITSLEDLHIDTSTDAPKFTVDIPDSEVDDV